MALSRYVFICRLEYKLVLKLVIMHSPRGLLLTPLFNYIFNSFLGKNKFKSSTCSGTGSDFIVTSLNCFHYLTCGAARVIMCDWIPGCSCFPWKAQSPSYLPSLRKMAIIIAAYTNTIFPAVLMTCHWFALSCNMVSHLSVGKWGKLELVVGGGNVPSWLKHQSKPLISGN